MTFTAGETPLSLLFMPQSAAVLCDDDRSLQTLKETLKNAGIEFMNCHSQQEALESVMSGHCSTLVVDFDMPGARDVMRMAELLPEAQRPLLLAVARRAWPGTGQAFQSGAARILYKPIDAELAKASLKGVAKAGKGKRRSARYEVKTLVYLELENGPLPAVSIDIGEQGLALQAAEPVPMGTNLPFRCVLPGTTVTLQGHADVIWASENGRAGLFFSKLTPGMRKHLKEWISKRGNRAKDKSAVRDLLPPEDAHVCFAASGEEELQEV